MKLDQLMKREQFPSILTTTLSKYFRSSKQWEGDIFWGSHGGDEALNLIVNSKLNLIYPSSMPKEKLVPLAAEYSYHVNPLRSLAQKFYISITLSPFFRRFFSNTKLHITNKSNLPCKICILPGNHSIRIVDLDLDECVVLIKDGFNPNKMINLVSIRQAYPNLPGPKIIDSNTSNRWYKEERIFGLPINRVVNNEKINKSLDAAKDFLLQMYQDTESFKQIDWYIKERFKQIDIAISSLPDCFKESDIDYIKTVKSNLYNIGCRELNMGSKITISQTHGDLQDANLLVPFSDTTRDVYIIDWEYTNIRCSHYDWFVYGFQSRSPKGLSSRIQFL